MPMELLTDYDLVMPYGDKDLAEHWLSWWLVAWCHQAISLIKNDQLSVRLFGIHPRAMYWKYSGYLSMLEFENYSFKNTAASPNTQLVNNGISMSEYNIVIVSKELLWPDVVTGLWCIVLICDEWLFIC